MTKYLSIFLVCMLAASNISYSQFSVGESSFHILSGTPVFVDSLVVIPDGNQEIKDNTLIISREAVPGTPNGSIARVYQWMSGPLDYVGGDIGFFLNPTESELNGNPQAGLQLAFSPTISNNFTVSSSSTSDVPNNYLSDNMDTRSWQQLTAVRIGSILPLKLLSFDAGISGNEVIVTWQIAQEDGVEKYVVTRSTDGNEFYPIGTVAPICNSCQKDFDYSYMDDDAFDGINFYRLNIVGVDGSIKYSDVVRIKFDRGIAIVVSPNPAQTELNLSGLSPDRQYQLSVYSAEGKLIYKQSSIQRTYKLRVNVADWTTGMYFIHLSDSQKNGYRFKVMKK